MAFANEMFWCDGCESPQRGPHEVQCLDCERTVYCGEDDERHAADCECYDPPDAQDIAEAKADDRLRELKEEGPRRDLDEYDERSES